MKLKIKTIEIKTIEDIKKAEKLTDKGWKIGSVGFNTIELYKQN